MKSSFDGAFAKSKKGVQSSRAKCGKGLYMILDAVLGKEWNKPGLFKRTGSVSVWFVEFKSLGTVCRCRREGRW